jgi:multidrug efflux pump subunit AcrA (membrane-fusion protein)
MGTTLGIVSSIDAGEIRLPISSADYSYLTDGDRSDVVLKRFENGIEQQWLAKIVRDEGVIDENSRMIYLVAEIKQPYKASPKLKFGTFVDAAVQSEIHDNIAIIPNHLYREGHVTLVSGNRELHKQTVKLLKRDKTNVYIASGLQTGDLILDTKIEHLYEGMKVRLAGDKEEIAPVAEDELPVELAAGEK